MQVKNNEEGGRGVCICTHVFPQLQTGRILSVGAELREKPDPRKGEQVPCGQGRCPACSEWRPRSGRWKTALTSKARPSKCLAVEVASSLALSPQALWPQGRVALPLCQSSRARNQHHAATWREPSRALRQPSALSFSAPGLCLGWKSFEVCAWQAGP